jgi:hypothetical protein
VASVVITVKQGEAELTIFVKPNGAGSTVLVMTEGLDWSEKEK